MRVLFAPSPLFVLLRAFLPCRGVALERSLMAINSLSFCAIATRYKESIPSELFGTHDSRVCAIGGVTRRAWEGL